MLAHNAAGGVWLVVDGMVLDVKRWLPEHPGGDRIIPQQSLGAEAARHFELYHSSKAGQGSAGARGRGGAGARGGVSCHVL